MKRLLWLLAPLMLLGCSDNVKEAPKSVPYVLEENMGGKPILSIDEVKKLTVRLDNINKNLKFQVLVRIIPKTPPEGLERYSTETFNKIGIGNKYEDKGALYVLAPLSRQIRLETGRGTEGYIPDHKAKEILVVSYPYFRMGQWYNGLNASLDEFEKQVKEK